MHDQASPGVIVTPSLSFAIERFPETIPKRLNAFFLPLARSLSLPLSPHFTQRRMLASLAPRAIAQCRGAALCIMVLDAGDRICTRINELFKEFVSSFIFSLLWNGCRRGFREYILLNEPL